MKVHAWNAADWFFIGLLVIVIVWGYVASRSRLEDPNDQSVVPADDLQSLALIDGSGEWSVVIFRQSGGVHSWAQYRGDGRAVLREVLATFRRAKIDAVVVVTNTADKLEVHRLWHNHRGRQEGKRVGGAVIQRTA